MTEWLGHRDLCCSQWSPLCDCRDPNDPVEITAPQGSRAVQCADEKPHGAHGEWYGKGDGPDSWWCPGAVEDNQI